MPNVIYKKYSVLGQPRYWNRRKRMWTKWLSKGCHYPTHHGALRVLHSRRFSKNIWNLTEKDLLTKKETLAEYGVQTLC